VEELENSKNEELIDFRVKLFDLVKSKLNTLKELNQNEYDLMQTEFVYSPNLEIDTSLFEISLTNKMSSLRLDNELETIQANVHVTESNSPSKVYTFNVSLSCTPSDIVSQTITAKLASLNQTAQQISTVINRYKNSYLLNVCGCSEVFYGNNFKISSYKVIYCLKIRSFSFDRRI
jgi:hypothetical protein